MRNGGRDRLETKSPGWGSGGRLGGVEGKGVGMIGLLFGVAGVLHPDDHGAVVSHPLPSGELGDDSGVLVPPPD